LVFWRFTKICLQTPVDTSHVDLHTFLCASGDWLSIIRTKKNILKKVWGKMKHILCSVHFFLNSCGFSHNKQKWHSAFYNLRNVGVVLFLILYWRSLLIHFSGFHCL
jgi:hypothetical protein